MLIHILLFAYTKYSNSFYPIRYDQILYFRPRKEKSGNGRGRPRKKDVVVQEKEDTEVSILLL